MSRSRTNVRFCPPGDLTIQIVLPPELTVAVSPDIGVGVVVGVGVSVGVGVAAAVGEDVRRGVSVLAGD